MKEDKRVNHRAEAYWSTLPSFRKNEIVLSEEEAVLNEAREIRRGPIPPAQAIPNYLLEGWQVVFLGMPGSGKSTLLLQSESAAKRNARIRGISYFPRIKSYDTFLGEYKGPEDTEFNEAFYRYVQGASLVEVPAVGATTLKNRGVNTFHKLAEDVTEKRDPKKLFVAVVGNPLLEVDATFTRYAVSQLDPSQVFNVLENVYNVSIAGVERTPENARIVKDIFANMANSEHVRVIRAEMNHLIGEWSTSEIKKAFHRRRKKYDPFRERSVDLVRPNVRRAVVRRIYEKHGVSFQGVEGHARKLTEEANEAMVREAIYWEDILKNQMSLGSGHYMVIYNKIRKGLVTVDYSPIFEEMRHVQE